MSRVVKLFERVNNGAAHRIYFVAQSRWKAGKGASPREFGVIFVESKLESRAKVQRTDNICSSKS